LSVLLAVAIGVGLWRGRKHGAARGVEAAAITRGIGAIVMVVLLVALLILYVIPGVMGKWVTIRVPYPMGMYSKRIDGRIDNPNGGWKGRGLWVTTSTRTPFHMETGRRSRCTFS